MPGITSLRWITLVAVLFWLAFYWHAGSKVITDIKESLRSGNSRLDAVLLIVITACSFVIISMGFLLNLGRLSANFPQNLSVTLAGTLLSVSGIIGMFYCRRYLGKFWTAETHVTQGHQVIDTGPYRFVRHPIYTFAILMYLGFGLVFLSQWNAALVVLIVAAYILKAGDEDIFLGKNLPGYREYKLRVRYRLIPGLW